tara:strand:- start:71 stop:448 length:378 start_codon:yes stop_codon:yes gene_type:complete
MPAKSKTQQRLMGMAYSVKKGDSNIKDIDSLYRDKVKDLVDGMSLSKLKDYAETNHTNLPDKVDEDAVNVNPNMNVPGMGNIKLPGNPGTLDGFTTQEVGSGDLPLGKKKKKRKVVMTFEQFMNQ